MDYQELKRLTDEAPASMAKDYRKLLSFSGVAGRVWPQFRAHLEGASSLEQFYEAIYNDDACRFENVWAYWAKLRRKNWIPRFDFEQVVHQPLLDERGVFLTGKDGNEMLIPLHARNHPISLYVFDDSTFNEKAAEMYGSIYGSYSCCGIALEGAYDIYRADRALIFERWQIDKFMARANGKGRISESGN